MSLTITVNNRTMLFEREEDYLTLPILSRLNSRGKPMFWKITVEGNSYYTTHWVEGGKHKVSDPILVNGKNIGRSNETTQEDQTLFEAYSKWLSVRKKDYHPVTDTLDNPMVLRPMLAFTYEKYAHKLIEPFYISPKVDGVRCISKGGELYSREGTEFSFLLNIKKQLQELPTLILDGELYNHDIPFKDISGCVRSTKKKSIHDDTLEYWIFDIVDDTLPFEKRHSVLVQLKENVKHLPNIKILESHIAGYKDIRPFHDACIKDGYEGVVLRNKDSTYQYNKRSFDFLKFKVFSDSEFKICGYKEARGNDAGTIVFKCTTDKGKTFEVRPKGSVSYRKQLLQEGDDLIGKYLTVKYQGMNDGVPRFPVGIDIRDYE